MTTHELARTLMSMPNVPVVISISVSNLAEIADAQVDSETFWDRHGDRVHEVCAVLE